ncbi:MAG: hypothetical protein ABSH48_15255 [Verrucomicrobiota bacterium]|jgi:hypothetical protein
MSSYDEREKLRNEQVARLEEEALRRREREDEKLLQEEAKARYDQQFEKVNRRELAGWPDEKLAAWQAKFPSESPQFILAQFEWNRRLTADQVKAARWASWIGLAGVIVGALLTRILEKL